MANPKQLDAHDKRAWAFEDLLIAAMKDAALNRQMTQLKATITPTGSPKEIHVRIIVVPEQMDVEWPQGLEKTRNEVKDPKADQKPFERTPS